MAKLSSRGRTTVAEFVREYTEEQLQARTDRRNAHTYPGGTWNGLDGNTPGPLPDSIRLSLTNWERITRRLMSDGTVLEKVDCRFRRSAAWEPAEGRRHSYGWKVHGKIKAGLTTEDFIRIYTGPLKSGAPSPWTHVTNASGKVPVLTAARVKRAPYGTGFCYACGASRSGCEPDARAYPCESCGKHEVYGKEEILLSLAG